MQGPPRSSEISQRSATIVGAGETIRCLRDHIVVEPLPRLESDVLDVIEHGKPLRGTVRAVGPGHYPLRYDHPDKHVRKRSWRSPCFQPTQVRVGDIVELGGLRRDGRIDGYAFQSFLWGDREHLICREADVSGIIEAV